MEIKDLHRLFLESSGVSTDTRKIKTNSLFFALKGENFNGNDFALKAIEAGAAFAIIDEEITPSHSKLIRVKNALESLQKLAAYHRNQLKTKIIGLTGSNGKTTTKELINACLSRKYKTVATTGNLNNHIGVPLTLLSLTEDTEFGIIEMGANHPGEIAFLCNIANPDFGYITNFGKAHLEGFKTLEGVIIAKSELYQHLKKNHKRIFLNIDDPVQAEHATYSNTFSFGSNKEADLKINFLNADPYAGISTDTLEVHSNLIGNYNAKNMAAAYSIGHFFKVPASDLKAALEEYIPANNRSQILEIGSNRIILDAYNANPTSMAAAIENLDNLKSEHKIAVLGDMFEMGNHSEEEHQKIVDLLKDSSIQTAYIIGENFYKTNTSSAISKYRNLEDFTSDFSLTSLEKAVVLIKGSRGMRLEKIVETTVTPQ